MKYKWLLAGGLGLALLAICAVMVGILWVGLGVVRSDGLRLRLFSADTVSAETDEEQRFTVSGPAELVVENVIGNVTVTAGSEDEIVVKAHKTAWGATEAEAQADLDALQISLTQDGDKVTVKVTRPDEMNIVGSTRLDTVALDISVPAETAVTASTDFGDVTASGVKRGVELQTKFGKVEAKDAAGDVNLETDFGDVTLRTSRATSVRVSSKSGALILQEVEADDEVNLATDFGSITFDSGSAAALTVDTKSGAVKLSSLTVSRTVTAHSDFGELTLEQVNGAAYDLSSKSGAIRVEGAGGPVKAHTDFGEVEITGGEAVTLDLKTNSGAVRYAGTLGDGPHTVQTDFGSIWLTLPEDAALDLDLQTDFGKVKSDLPVTLSGEFGDEQMRGVLNGGGPSLTVHTQNGNISLEILNP